MMKKIAILLSVLLLAPLLVSPGGAAASNETANLYPDDNRAVSGSWTTFIGPLAYFSVESYYEDPAADIYVQKLEVRFKNWGDVDAYNLTATVSYLPIGTEAPDDVVTLDLLVAHDTDWTTDNFTLRTILSEVVDPYDTIKWLIEYYDEDGNYNSIEDVLWQYDAFFIPPLPSEIPPVTISTFEVVWAKIDFKNKPDHDKARVRGILNIDGDVDVSEAVTVTIGPLVETINMEAKGKEGQKWQYRRPKDGTGNIRQMTINWKKGKFNIRIDRADLTGVTNPVYISIQIGDDFVEETILMKERRRHWKYRAH